MPFLVFPTFLLICLLSPLTVKAIAQDYFNVSRPTCEDHVLVSNSSSQVIKSMSMYRDQVVLLYGDENETDSVFLYRFRPVNLINLTNGPLYGLELDKGEVFEQDLLANAFPGLAVYIDKYEIVSLLYFNDQLVLCFFRDVLESKTIFVIHDTKAVIQLNSVQSATHQESHAVLLYHFNGNNSNASSSTFPAYFITLDDQSFQQGTVEFSDNSKLVLKPNQSRLMGTDIELHDKLYLLSDRFQAQKYFDFAPFYMHLKLQDWRVLLHYDYIYVLSGYKSGMVFYFKPMPLSRYDDNTTLEQRMGQISYARFFGCSDDPFSAPTFPPEIVLVHYGNIMRTFFFYYLLILLVLIILLFILCCCFYTPAQKRMFRLCITTDGTTNQDSFQAAANSNSSGSSDASPGVSPQPNTLKQ